MVAVYYLLRPSAQSTCLVSADLFIAVLSCNTSGRNTEQISKILYGTQA